MDILFLIAALVDGPFRGIVGIMLMVPIALAVFLLCWWLARRHPLRASRYLRWMPSLCALAFVFAVAMDFLRPIRSLQDTMGQRELGKLTKQQAHDEIDRHYSVKGLLLRGLVHYGPITLMLFSSLGLYVGRSLPAQPTQPI